MHSFEKLREVVSQIRKECPWDKKQTFDTLKKHLIEESYEYVEAVDKKDSEEMTEELGDVLLQIMLNSEIASETNLFNVDNVIHAVTQKMIDRHPHIFGELKDQNLTEEQVKKNWEVLKSNSKKKRESILDGVPKALPALMKAQQTQQKCAHVGFDWNTAEGAFDKVKEELSEFEDELNSGDKKKQEEEFGDLLFAMANVGRKLGFDIENCLNQTTQKFTRRFNYIEEQYNSTEELKNAGLEELDSHWEDAKKLRKI